MNKATTHETAAEAVAKAKRYWLADNPGILTRTAEELSVSQPFVSDVFYGRRNSSSGEVEARLAELGAPGVSARKC